MSMAVDEETLPPRDSRLTDPLAEDVEPNHPLESAAHYTSFGAMIGEASVETERNGLDQPSETCVDPLQPTSVEQVNMDDPPTSLIALSNDARQIWLEHERATHYLSILLCEQLRLILEPTQATKLRGDFRTGKRLNMRRIIPYIASSYRKDRIWLRRTKPSKRQYQVMIAMDDSKSMSDSQSTKLALDTLALTAKALSQLEVGQISILRFGEDVRVVHGFEEQFTIESGEKVVQQFGFSQERTDVCALTRRSIELFESARAQQDVRFSIGELWQLEIIISDGICEDHDTIRQLVRGAFEKKIMIVFVILDALHPGRKDSILDIKSYTFGVGEEGQILKESRYLDSFPFNYFVIVRDIKELPVVLSSALRQWFAEITER